MFKYLSYQTTAKKERSNRPRRILDMDGSWSGNDMHDAGVP
jgi:hypothetical protein